MDISAISLELKDTLVFETQLESKVQGHHHEILTMKLLRGNFSNGGHPQFDYTHALIA